MASSEMRGILRVHAGFIDILAKDKSGRCVVIELKAGDAKPDAIAQILLYMSCVADDKNGQARGILIASDFVPRVRLAARAVPTLALQKYRFNFSFEIL
jgi:RecB family endonuclease NucS